jgi:uncharacterized protein YhbP (UPF0306 family)
MFMKESYRAFAGRLVEAASVGVLGTVFEGKPMTATIFIVTGDGRRLYYKSRTDSQHAKALWENKAAALAVYDEESSYEAKTGVQLTGTSGQVMDAGEMEKVVMLYGRKFGAQAAAKLSVAALLVPDAVSTMFYFDVEEYKLVSHELDVHMKSYELW